MISISIADASMERAYRVAEKADGSFHVQVRYGWFSEWRDDLFSRFDNVHDAVRKMEAIKAERKVKKIVATP